MRLGQLFLNNRGKTFQDFNLDTDLDPVLEHNGVFTFYHYTRPDRTAAILQEGSGLWARRIVACPDPPEEFTGSFLIEGFLSALPSWLKTSTYYNDLCYEMTRKYIGNHLLEVAKPIKEFDIFIADYAHILECRMLDNRGKRGLGLGYDCSKGWECTQAYVNSYIPIQNYAGQHHAPLVQVLRKGEGVAVPHRYIKVSAVQPLLHSDMNRTTNT